MGVILLIGPMGAGKSTLGKTLAKRLGLGFTDLDEEIVAQAGMSIPEIFSRLGERVFRQYEAQNLAQAVELKRVLATGGGVVLRESNRKILHQNPPVVWLDAPPEVLARRIAGDANRPLLAGVDPLAKARELDTVRRQLYAECANLHVRTDQFDAEQAVDYIIAYLTESGHA